VDSRRSVFWRTKQIQEIEQKYGILKFHDFHCHGKY